MAQHQGKQGEWPIHRGDPVGYFQNPNGILKSTRSLAGPLRLGTEPRVGPRGFLRDGNASDFGMDRITPRRFDPMGSHNTREPPFPSSTLLSRESRAKNDSD